MDSSITNPNSKTKYKEEDGGVEFMDTSDSLEVPSTEAPKEPAWKKDVKRNPRLARMLSVTLTACDRRAETAARGSTESLDIMSEPE